jgi:hypothetical protein
MQLGISKFLGCKGNISYAPQQLPGVPQEFGDPQQPPPGIPPNCGDELVVLWADISFVSSVLAQDLHCNVSSSLKMMNSLTAPHLLHLYS